MTPIYRTTAKKLLGERKLESVTNKKKVSNMSIYVGGKDRDRTEL
jgi:hypothetical protein